MELLDFIHVFIEDAVQLVDEALHEKSLKDYLEGHLQEKYVADDNVAEMVQFLDSGFKVQHAIALFDFVVKKMRERK
jgi:hypothetical protein